MSDPRWREEISKQTWRLQLIVGALTTGSLVFLGIVLFLVHFGAAPNELDFPLSYVLVVFALAALAARAIVPPVITSNARRRIREGTWQQAPSGTVPQGIREFLGRTGDGGKLWQVLMARTIVASAILEGAAFFACVTYLLEHSMLSLGIAMVFIASLALHLPTQAGMINWIEEQLRLLEEERQLGR